MSLWSRFKDRVRDFLEAPPDGVDALKSWVIQDILQTLSVRAAAKGYLCFVSVDGVRVTFSVILPGGQTKSFEGVVGDDLIDRIGTYIQELPNNPAPPQTR